MKPDGPEAVFSAPADLGALAVTAAAATRLPMMATAGIAIATSAALHGLAGGKGARGVP